MSSSPLRWPEAPGWNALFQPVSSLLEVALPRLTRRPSRLPRLVAGAAGGPLYRLDQGCVALSPALLGPEARWPEDAGWAASRPAELAPLVLDRWRRAAGAVLEAVALLAQAEDAGVAPADWPLAWWTLGPAAEDVDRAAPILGWLWPEAADLLLHPEQSLEAAPRRAAWLSRWRAATGQPAPPVEARPPAIEAQAWAEFGRWLRDPRQGPAAQAPLPLPLRRPAEQPGWRAEALSHRVVALTGGPAGGLATATGATLAEPLALADGACGVAVLGSVEAGDCAVRLRALGPVGAWSLATGEVQRRVGAARGVDLHLDASGRANLVLANAFMGLPTIDMLALSDRIGVSGVASGQWRVSEADPGGGRAGALTLNALVPQGLTVHSRGGHGFAIPAASVLGPVHQILAALNGARWRFHLEDRSLVLEGEVLGVTAVLRLRPA